MTLEITAITRRDHISTLDSVEINMRLHNPKLIALKSKQLECGPMPKVMAALGI